MSDTPLSDSMQMVVDAYNRQLAAAIRERDETRAELAKVHQGMNSLHVALEIAAQNLDEIGGDYPGSSCSMWCEGRAAEARAVNARVAIAVPLPPSAAPEAGPKPDYCCIAPLDAARARAWKDRNTRCGCDHNESCAECFPPAFHTGGYWDQQRASLQQSPAQPEGK